MIIIWFIIVNTEDLSESPWAEQLGLSNFSLVPYHEIWNTKVGDAAFSFDCE